jgi:MFS family permease
VFAAPLAGRLADKYSSAMLSTAELAILSVGLALMAAIGQGANLHGILWQAFVCGVGFGLFQTPNNREMLGTVAREHLVAASGVLALAPTFGQTVGIALAALALAAAGGASGIRLALGAWRSVRQVPHQAPRSVPWRCSRPGMGQARRAARWQRPLPPWARCAGPVFAFGTLVRPACCA